MSQHLSINGHLVLCFAERDPATSDGVSLDGTLPDGARFSVGFDMESLFVTSTRSWRETAEDERLLVFLPGPLGTEVLIRAPKRLFREVHAQA
jgi:hypothetical protein